MGYPSPMAVKPRYTVSQITLRTNQACEKSSLILGWFSEAFGSFLHLLTNLLGVVDIS